MKTDLIAVGSCQKRIDFTIPADKVRQELDRAYRALGTRVRLPGFRPGKAPRKVLEMRFGSQVAEDVAATLIQQGYTDALQQHSIEPVGRPQVEQGDLKPSNDFTFSITVDVKPEIELSVHTGLDVEYPKVTVSDDEVHQLVRARLEGQARLVEVTDRPVARGDMVLVTLTAKDGDEVVSNEPGTMIRTAADPYYPGVDALLVGMSVDEEKTAKVAFPAEARVEAVAGRELDVTAKVISIQANEIPALDDAIAEELGFEGGAAGMRAALTSQLTNAREAAARNQARANLLQVLIDKNPFDVPSGMVEQQLGALIEELRLQAAYAGRDPRSINYSAEQIADLRVRAEFAVKGGLILDWVSRSESIEVTDADLEAKYQEMADQRGQTLEAIKGYFVKEGVVDELRDRLLEEKTLDWLLERANLVEPKPGEKAAKKPAAPKEQAAAAEAAPAAGEADLSVLKGAVGAIKEAIESGAHDADLQALLAAEEAGKARKGVVTVLRARVEALG